MIGHSRTAPPPLSHHNAARRAVRGTIARGAAAYDRALHLPRLIPVGPDEIADVRIEARRRIAAKLARALRAERNRGRAGHWTYDLNRHIGLHQAYEAERREIDAPVITMMRKVKRT